MKQSSARHLPSLATSREEAKRLLNHQMQEGLQFLETIKSPLQTRKVSHSDLTTWHSYTCELLRRVFDTDELMREFAISPGKTIMLTDTMLGAEASVLGAQFVHYLRNLQGIVTRIDLFQEASTDTSSLQDEPRARVEQIARRFHVVANQLRRRHGNRPTLSVADEYDVQDLLHALLKLFFNDVRAEEWTPSYAGGSARMDFLLKAEQVVVEVKKTRPGLTDRNVGNELLEDIGRYRAHPDCRSLLCFVYDPDGYIANPDALERDLSRVVDELSVSVIIAPKGL